MNRIPLHFASEHQDPEILRYHLINYDASPNARSKDQEIPLFLVASRNREKENRSLHDCYSTVSEQIRLEATRFRGSRGGSGLGAAAALVEPSSRCFDR